MTQLPALAKITSTVAVKYARTVKIGCIWSRLGGLVLTSLISASQWCDSKQHSISAQVEYEGHNRWPTTVTTTKAAMDEQSLRIPIYVGLSLFSSLQNLLLDHTKFVPRVGRAIYLLGDFHSP